MKKYSFILYLSITFFLINCDGKLEKYHTHTNRLNFVFSTEADSVITHSFVYIPIERTIDTAWIEIATMGFLTDYDRYISLEQILTGENDAIANIHYQAFDEKNIIMPAQKNKAKIPIVLYRNDPALKNSILKLKIGIVNNDYFQTGYEQYRYQTILISDQPLQPSSWDRKLTALMLGNWGPEKHRFMIRVTGERIDDEWCKKISTDDDRTYMSYMRNWFTNKLTEENSKRQSAGLPPLSEEDGTIVSFF